MKKIHIKASIEYDVLIEKGLLDQAGKYISDIPGVKNALIVSDDIVEGLYSGRLRESLADTGIHVETFVFPNGEQSKNLSVYAELLEYMNSVQLTRSDIVIALGGGVTGDLAGFAAATYQRGIKYVQIPTTLLAAVDSSVGGKTAVDLGKSKNQVGSFHQPSLVICDPETLDTLPQEQFNAGCAEVIKYAVIGDAEFFEMIKDGSIRKNIENVIATCVSMKRDIVEKDEFDTGKRMLLNFGHTLGHASEACSDFSILHGEGVAMGMASVARAAQKQGICPPGTAEAIEDILNVYGLPNKIPYSKEEIINEMMADKKKTGDHINFVLPERIGKCFIKKMSVAEADQLTADAGLKFITKTDH